MRSRLSHQHRRRTGAQPERGETLIEVLATVILLGTAIVGLVTLMLAVVVSAHGHRRSVRSGIEAVSIAEAVEGLPYIPCTTPGFSTDSYDDALTQVMTSELTGQYYQADVISIRFLTAGSVDSSGNPSTLIPNVTSLPSGAAFQASCPTTDVGLQELTIRVENNTSNRVRETLVFIKRMDTCPGTVAVGQRC